MKKIQRIWLIFGILFILLSFFHFYQSSQKISEFKVTSRSDNLPEGIQIKVGIANMDIDKPLNDFAKDFNEYLNDYNNSNRTINLISALGYFIASLTAFYSMYLSK